MRLPARSIKPGVITAITVALAAAAVLAGISGQARASQLSRLAPAAGQAQAQAIVKAAKTWLTSPVTPYCWGGGGDTGPTHGDGEVAGIYTGPKGKSGCAAASVKGFDCSGLVKYAIYHALGISLVHLAQDQLEGLTDTGPNVHPGLIAIADVKPGDVVVFGNSKTSIQHDGIYIGGGNIINAYDYKNNGDNGTNNQYWGVVTTPLSWAKGGFSYVKAVRYWKTTSSPAPSPSPSRSTAPVTPPPSPSPAPSAAATDDWGQGGHDPARNYDNSGETTIGTGNVGGLVKAWSVSASSRSSQPVVYHGEVYRLTGTTTGSGSGTDVLTARRVTNGKKLWTKSLGGNGLDTLYAAGDGELIYGTAGPADTLVAVSASTGAQLWTETDTAFAAGDGEVIIEGSKVIDGILSVQVLSAATGKQLWSATDGAGDGGPDAFAVSGGKLVRTAAIGGKTYLEARNESNGTVDWKRLAPCASAVNNTVVSIGRSTVFVHDSCSGHLRAYRLSSGKPTWSAADPDGQGGLGMATNGTDVYAMALSSQQPSVAAYSGGKVIWQASLPVGTYPGAGPTLGGGVLYVTVTNAGGASGASERTTAFNARTGAKLWTSPVLKQTLDTPFVADGHLLVGAEVFRTG